MSDVAHVEKRTNDPGRVVAKLRRVAFVEHLASASEEFANVNAQKSGGQRSDGGQDTVSSTDAWRNFECRNRKFLCERPQRAVLRICYKDEVVRYRESCRGYSIVHDQKLRHRFCRATRLRCDDEQGSVELQTIQHRDDGNRIDIVKHVKPRRATTSLTRQFIPTGAAQGSLEGNRSQSRAADAKNDNVLVSTSDSRGKVDRLLQQRSVARKIHEIGDSLTPLIRDILVDRAEGTLRILPLCVSDAVLDGARHHIGKINRYHIRTVSPSKAGWISRGSSASRSAWKLSCVKCVRYVRSAPMSRATLMASGKLR